MRILITALFCLCAAFGQTNVSVSSGPPTDAFITLLDPGGPSGQPLYTGTAAAFLQPKSACSGIGSTCIKRSGGSSSGPSDNTPVGVLTSIVDAANTSTITCAATCGVWVKQRITIAGATVDTDLNGTYIVLTTPSATTFTITTANVSDATYNESTLVVHTNQPLTTQSLWTITAFAYDASNYMITATPANLSTTNPSWRGGLIWANRASY